MYVTFFFLLSIEKYREKLNSTVSTGPKDHCRTLLMKKI